MEYVSIDIETTGLDHQRCDVIEFGAVLSLDAIGSQDDSEMFHTYVLPNRDIGVYQGEPYALSMHSEILRRIAERNTDRYNFCQPHELLPKFKSWLARHKKKLPITVAGKNFAGFDLRFLELIHREWKDVFRHRVLDVGPLFLEPGDKVVPDLKTCMQRAGLYGEVSHTALDDAVVVNVLVDIALKRKGH